MTDLSLYIAREDDDPLADVRVSIGMKDELGAYLIFRGDPDRVAFLLRLVTHAGTPALLAREYDDKRGTSEGAQESAPAAGMRKTAQKRARKSNPRQED